MLTRSAPVEPNHVEDPRTADEPRAKGLEALASWRLWIISAALFVPFAILFFAGSAPWSIPEVEASCGQTPLDMRLFTSGDGVFDFLETCGPDGRRSYIDLQLADLVYPALVGIFLASSLALATKRLRSDGKLAWVAALPLLAAVFDYTENAMAWLAISAYPDPIITNEVLGLASAAKTITSWVGGVALLGCLGLLGLRRVRELTTRSDA